MPGGVTYEHISIFFLGLAYRNTGMTDETDFIVLGWLTETLV